MIVLLPTLTFGAAVLYPDAAIPRKYQKHYFCTSLFGSSELGGIRMVIFAHNTTTYMFHLCALSVFIHFAVFFSLANKFHNNKREKPPVLKNNRSDHEGFFG